VSGLFKNSVIETNTYDTLHPRACFHYHREEEQDPQATSKHLQEIVRQHKQGKLTRLTNKPPSIASFVYLHPRRRDVRCIAEEGKPHIFDMQIVEHFVNRAVELVPLTIKGKLGTPSRKTDVSIQLCRQREGM
jgi:hypothetical protein